MAEPSGGGVGGTLIQSVGRPFRTDPITAFDGALLRVGLYVLLFGPVVGGYVYWDATRRGLSRPRLRAVAYGPLGVPGALLYELRKGNAAGSDGDAGDRARSGSRVAALEGPSARRSAMRVTVLGTGGTIASTAGEGNEGATPTERGEELVAAVPELREIADVAVEQVAQVPSYEMDAATLEAVGERTRELDADPDADAVVITHGTDTMEETAYYLDAALAPATPVFLTGAQRRPDERSPDGPSNLLTAFRAADAFRSRESEGEGGDGAGGAGGAFVAFDEAVHAARAVTKTHTSKLAAFASPRSGPVATVDRRGVAVHRPPGSEADRVPTLSLDADVYAVKSGSGVTGELVGAALERGADGLVIEATGLGNATAGIGEAVREATDEGVPVVVASRCLAGRTAPVYGGAGGGETLRAHGAVFAGDLSAQKARIKLQLALDAYESDEGVRDAFAG